MMNIIPDLIVAETPSQRILGGDGDDKENTAI
jgi:hypothetical protein